MQPAESTPPTAPTISRRFHFCASHRLGLADDPTSDQELYGAEAGGAFGHGHNYLAYMVFAGDLDPATGILANLADVKRKVGAVIDDRYDHKHLNADTPPFDRIPATAENVARQLLLEVQERYGGEEIRPLACHLEQSSELAATAYADGVVELHRWISFSAARVTRSPNLSEEENHRLFGIAADPAGHGHNYRMRVTLRGEIDPRSGLIVPEAEVTAALGAVRRELDHRNLNLQAALLAGLPTTTESIAVAVRDRLARDLPVARLRLYELPEFFAEADGGTVRLGAVASFSAAHRLHSPDLSAVANRELYGKCNNPAGHGHGYEVEATVAGTLDQRSGTLCSLTGLQQGLADSLAGWRYRNLDAEVEEFAGRPSTGENIVSLLWPRLAPKLPAPLVRLRLSETENNRFTLRRQGLAA